MTNIGFTALIRSKGFNKQRLGEAVGLSSTQISNRISGHCPWTWKEVSAVCVELGITYDEFAGCFPAGDVRRSAARPAEEASPDEKAALDAMRQLLTVLKGA